MFTPGEFIIFCALVVNAGILLVLIDYTEEKGKYKVGK
jgi:hypothetical protein